MEATTTAVARPAPASVPQLPPRHWGFKHDREKVYAISLRGSPGLAGKIKVWIRNFELHAMAVYRLGQLALTLWERSKLLGAIPLAVFLVLDLLVRLVLHVQIPMTCRIGPAFHLGHAFTIIFGPSVIGANCNVAHNVTLGWGLGANGPGVPTIGDRVWIGPGVIITGPIRVGDGATISAGSVLSRDVPPRALVAGNPARVIQNDYDNAQLLGYSMPAGG